MKAPTALEISQTPIAVKMAMLRLEADLQKAEQRIVNLGNAIKAIKQAADMSDAHELPLLEDLDAAICSAVELVQQQPQEGEGR